jgi:rhamnose transport system permease protein
MFLPMALSAEETRQRGRWTGQEAVLVAVILIEIALFAALGRNFFTVENGFEIGRLGVEIGLLAVAMTPVIVSGGIDLSVGSMMGLAAVVFGLLWKDAGLPAGVCAAAAVAAGAAGGALNGLLVVRLRLPPLIVTLGTAWLFRGAAEGLTGGVRNFTGLPESFLFLGQGYLFGVVPPQLIVFAAVACAYAVFMGRTTAGRSIAAIGFSPEGAAHAGIPVGRRLAALYLLCGAAAGLAAVIYVAHLGQAKADAGTGYELMAITAVVLGGTSIFGGHGTIGGTLLGLCAISLLQNGLRLSDQPTELAGILAGALLIGSILAHRFWRRSR